MFDLIPFENRSNGLFDSFDRMMNDAFFGGAENELAPCRTDILDKNDRFVLKADMPGFRKEDINISIDGDVLTLSAERNEENKEDKKHFVRRERRYRSLSRSFDIHGINASQIKASYNNGVLELDLPKLVEAKPDTLKIPVQ